LDPEGYWTGFSARIRVIAYNTKLVKPDEAPRSVFDLADPKWRGQVAMADPRFGSTSSTLPLYAMAGDEKMDDFFRRLKANGVRVVRSTSSRRTTRCTSIPARRTAIADPEPRPARRSSSPVRDTQEAVVPNPRVIKAVR
jgi:hypothetical protein